MGTYVLAYNNHPGPLVVSADGRMLGGNEWGAVDSSARAVKALGDLLVIVDPLPAAGAVADADVAAAIAAVNERNGETPPAVGIDAEPAHRSRKAAS